jgi:hypothetical protein
MGRLLRSVAVFLLASVWFSPAMGQVSDPSYCSYAAFAPPGAKTVTRGEIVGLPNEHASLMEGAPWSNSNGAAPAYLVTGDRVDFVTECKGFSYVRFHGKSRTTSGWVDSHRLQVHGQPYIPLPANVAELCSTVESEVNSKFGEGLGSLASLPSKPVADGTIDLGPDPYPSSRALGYIPINLDGRPLAAVQLFGGGSCGTTHIYFWTGDLRHQLSPADTDGRNPLNLRFGGNGWTMDLREKIVPVAGQPMLLSTGMGADFELSHIDRTGDTQLVCHGRQRPMSGKPVVMSGDRGLCESLVSAAVAVVMKPAAEHITLPAQNTPEVSYKALRWGMVDLDNTGSAHVVGVLMYHFESAAGCGQDHDLEFPVLLDGTGNFDSSGTQGQDTLRALFGDPQDLSMGSQKKAVRIVRYRNQTYVELVDAGLVDAGSVDSAPVQSIWKFTKAGPQQVCKFQTRHYEVKPPTISEQE